MPLDFVPVCPSHMRPMRLRKGPYGRFWGCPCYPECDYLVGAHPDGKPLGFPADKETKRARIAAHAAFNPLFMAVTSGQGRSRARWSAYKWLAKRMGLPYEDCHIAMFDAAQCARVVELCRDMTPENVLEWLEERERARA